MSSQIPLGKIDEGIKKSIENATSYFEGALFLYKNKRYQSSILLSMLSYEEFGKALLLMDYKFQEKEITKTQWKKKFCNHKMKNLISIRAIWKDADFVPKIPEMDIHQARFDVDWKNIFTYTDYDFENRKWTSPRIPKTFGIKDIEQFSYRAISRVANAQKCVTKRATEFDEQ
jgi:AbiV family abortive infection protein